MHVSNRPAKQVHLRRTRSKQKRLNSIQEPFVGLPIYIHKHLCIIIHKADNVSLERLVVASEAPQPAMHNLNGFSRNMGKVDAAYFFPVQRFPRRGGHLQILSRQFPVAFFLFGSREAYCKISAESSKRHERPLGWVAAVFPWTRIIPLKAAGYIKARQGSAERFRSPRLQALQRTTCTSSNSALFAPIIKSDQNVRNQERHLCGHELQAPLPTG